MALPKQKDGTPILKLDEIEATAVEEAVSFDISARMMEQLPPYIRIFAKVGMSLQQAFYMGMAFERRHLDAEEIKQLEEHYHEFIEHMKKCKEEAEKEQPQYGDGEA